jgi:hypothetical protein
VASSLGDAFPLAPYPPHPPGPYRFTAAGRDEIAAYCGQDSQKQEQNWTRKYVCDIKITDAYLAVFNGLLVVVTTGLIFVGMMTIRKMRITEERQLRAYVLLETGFVELAADEASVAIEVRLKNYGQTPAYRVTSWMEGTVALIDANPFTVNPQGAADASKATVGPNANITARADKEPFTAAYLAGLRNRTHAFFIWGGTEYVDAFKRKRRFIFRTSMTGPETPVPMSLNEVKGWILSPHSLGYDGD